MIKRSGEEGRIKLRESEVKPRETGSQNEVLTTEAQN